MRTESYYTQFWSELSHYVFGYNSVLFFKSKKSLEEYENRAMRPETLIKIIDKEKQSAKLPCLEILLKPIFVYVEYLFLMVHAGFYFSTKSDISERYFNLLDEIEEFFINIHKKFPDQFNHQMEEAYVKIIIIFNTWDKIMAKDPKCGPYAGGVYHHLSMRYFQSLYPEKKLLDYDDYLHAAYKDCAKTVNLACLKPVFTQLSGESTRSFEGGRLFRPLSSQESEESLIKYKLA